MRAIGAVATNTFREAVRDRVLYLILFFAVLIILGSELLSALAVGDPIKVVLDLGLAAIAFFGVLISVFLGLSAVSREIDRRTVYSVLSKPISRGQFMIGKLCGIYATVALLTACMAIVFLAFVWLRHDAAHPGLVKAIALSLVEDLLIANFALLFSSFTTPILATLFTMTTYVVGHMSYGLQQLASYPEVAGTVWGSVLSGLYVALPNLERFNVRGAAVNGEPLSSLLLLTAAAYGVGYSIVVLSSAIAIFSRRDFV